MNEDDRPENRLKKYRFRLLACVLAIVPAALILWTVDCTVTVADLCGGEVPESLRDSVDTDYGLTQTVSELITTPEQLRDSGGLLPELFETPVHSFELNGNRFVRSSTENGRANARPIDRTYQTLDPGNVIVLTLVETEDGVAVVSIVERVGVQAWLD